MSVRVGVTDCQVIRSVDELETLATEWNTLSRRFGMLFLDHEWFLAAARTLYPPDTLRVVVIRESGTVVAIAPLVLSRRFAGRLSVLGACVIFEPGGWLYASADVLAPLAHAVFRLGLVASLQRVPVELAEALPRLARTRGLAVVRPAKGTLTVDTAGGFDAHLARLSPRALRERKQMRSRERRAGATMSISRVRATRDEIDRLLDEFVAVEAAGWKGREGSALARSPDLQAFYRSLLREAAIRRCAIISTMLVGARPVAVELAVEAHRRIWSLKIGYDESFASISPGLLLVDASVRATFAEALDAYEFLGAAEDWQERWAPTERAYRAVTLYPFSSRGLFGAGADAAQYFRRRRESSRSV